MNNYYFNTIENLNQESNEDVFNKLCGKDEFASNEQQKKAWKEEIRILQDQLEPFLNGHVILEYTIPRIGKRIDAICIINNLLFVIEFKVGADKYTNFAKDQTLDYCLNLKYFHEESKDIIIIPVLIATEATESIIKKNNKMDSDDKIYDICCINKDGLTSCIEYFISECSNKTKKINPTKWINAKYAPTPTIIEAAQYLYRHHEVGNIKQNGAEDISITTKTINDIINKCKENKKKAICFITGVPGAGKTLVGLEIANSRHSFKEEEHAVFASGNGPLVDVLQHALAIDITTRTKKTKKEALTETTAFIQDIYQIRREALGKTEPPIEKVIIFDEAQRSWDEKTLTSFLKDKRVNYSLSMSEPEFMLQMMDRHEDWAVIICLVGTGQEIYKGEAGIGTWFEALDKYSDWSIYTSNQIDNKNYFGGSNKNRKNLFIKNELHLNVDQRSFRAKSLSIFVDALLENRIKDANQIYQGFKKDYHIFITRDLNKAKKWVRNSAHGKERYGLIASSGGKRLRAEGIWVPTNINHISWFLDGKGKVDSSYQLEVAASEFKVQGLEIDYAILAWDANFRYENNNFAYYQLGVKQQKLDDKRVVGSYREYESSWNKINNDQEKTYLKNAYRVLLTRARQGLIIFIPKGNNSDPTTLSEYYDGTYNYLREIGIEEMK